MLGLALDPRCRVPPQLAGVWAADLVPGPAARVPQSRPRQGLRQCFEWRRLLGRGGAPEAPVPAQGDGKDGIGLRARLPNRKTRTLSTKRVPGKNPEDEQKYAMLGARTFCSAKTSAIGLPREQTAGCCSMAALCLLALTFTGPFPLPPPSLLRCAAADFEAPATGPPFADADRRLFGGLPGPRRRGALAGGAA